MSNGIRSILAVALVLVAGAASAQSAEANQQRCQQLTADVQQQFQASIQARVPKQDPTSFNQEGYDIRGIMAQDVTAGLGKLLSGDFSGILDKVVQKGMDRALSKATSNFSNKINGVLQSAGVQGVSFNGTQLSVNHQQLVGGAVNGAVNSAVKSDSRVASGLKGAVTTAATRSIQPGATPYGVARNPTQP